MITIIPAPAYVLARAAWAPTLVLRHADGCFARLESPPCMDYAPTLADLSTKGGITGHFTGGTMP